MSDKLYRLELWTINGYVDCGMFHYCGDLSALHLSFNHRVIFLAGD